MSLLEKKLRELDDTLKVAANQLILAEQRIRLALAIRSQIAAALPNDKTDKPASGCSDRPARSANEVQ